MLRSILAVVLGVLVASAVVYVGEMAGHRLYPTPSIGAVDCSISASYAEKTTAQVCIAATPFGAKFAVVVGWFLGALAGGVAALLAGRKWAPLAWLVALIVFLLCVFNFMAFPHPIWMIVGAVLAALLGGFGATTLVGARNAMPATTN